MWVDDVLPNLAAVVSPEELSILGLMIWGEKGRTEQWVEPFFASVRVSESCELLGYRIMSGDAAAGLAKNRYGMHVKLSKRQFEPEDWMFVFSQGKL